VFLDKLKAQGWFELFTNTQLGCSQPDVAEFYANVSVSEGIRAKLTFHSNSSKSPLQKVGWEYL